MTSRPQIWRSGFRTAPTLRGSQVCEPTEDKIFADLSQAVLIESSAVGWTRVTLDDGLRFFVQEEPLRLVKWLEQRVFDLTVEALSYALQKSRGDV